MKFIGIKKNILYEYIIKHNKNIYNKNYYNFLLKYIEINILILNE